MAKKAGKIKQQHYVPQEAHLRRWANPDSQVWEFDKTTQQARKNRTKNVAQEGYFYDITSEPDDPQPGEHLLQEVEGRFKEAVDTLLGEAETVGIRYELRSKLAPYIAVQFLRTREIRNMVVQSTDALLRQVRDAVMAQKFPDLNPDDIEVSLKASGQSLMHARLLFNEGTIGRAAAILEAHYWILGTNRTSNALYTADHPVAVHETIQDPLYSNAGIASPGGEIAFPLSPRHVLVMLERTRHERCAPFDLKCIRLEGPQVEYYNSLQVVHSTRSVISSADDFDLARKVCAANPDVCDPNRQRISVTQISRG